MIKSEEMAVYFLEDLVLGCYHIFCHDKGDKMEKREGYVGCDRPWILEKCG